MYSAINAITDKSKAKALHASLYASYVQRAGEKQAAHLDRMCISGSMWKAEGLAWWKDRCRAMAGAFVDADAKVSHFIPPSPETLAWGGFLGGEHISYMDKAKQADAEEMILARIARA